MRSSNNIRSKKILHGHGRLIELLGYNLSRKLFFNASSTISSLTSFVSLSLHGSTTGSFHGTLKLKTLQMPGSSLATS